MSAGIDYLHSHSELERILVFPKYMVIVDAKYKNLFSEDLVETFKYRGVTYCQVPTIVFVKRGGVFKNLKE
jgi:hypothetical protein